MFIWYKFSKTNATKDQSIRFISDYLKIPLRDFAAFGDDFADLPMLKLCKIGVAMGNAVQEVKDSADAVTLSNEEDGVAVWLEKNVL
ncbi:MAG: HAD hydrolase family protein [Treponema sp.]|nr:HAD hydrolase family protein [Treponema sp.]